MYRNFINRCSGFKQNTVSQATEVQQYCDLVATAYNWNKHHAVKQCTLVRDCGVIDPRVCVHNDHLEMKFNDL